jgi:hypothetical protein
VKYKVIPDNPYNNIIKNPVSTEIITAYKTGLFAKMDLATKALISIIRNKSVSGQQKQHIIFALNTRLSSAEITSAETNDILSNLVEIVKKTDRTKKERLLAKIIYPAIYGILYDHLVKNQLHKKLALDISLHLLLHFSKQYLGHQRFTYGNSIKFIVESIKQKIVPNSMPKLIKTLNNSIYSREPKHTKQEEYKKVIELFTQKDNKKFHALTKKSVQKPTNLLSKIIYLAPVKSWNFDKGRVSEYYKSMKLLANDQNIPKQDLLEYQAQIDETFPNKTNSSDRFKFIEFINSYQEK